MMKFSQNGHLHKLLLSTSAQELVEASPIDRVWGLGLSEKEATTTTTTKRWGQNLLGKAIMRIRSQPQHPPATSRSKDHQPTVEEAEEPPPLQPQCLSIHSEDVMLPVSTADHSNPEKLKDNINQQTTLTAPPPPCRCGQPYYCITHARGQPADFAEGPPSPTTPIRPLEA